MPADALARADRLAVSAIVLLRRSEKSGERTRALHDTLMEFRQLLVHIRFPVRHRLLEFGLKLAVAVTGLAAGSALHVYDVLWGAVPVAGVMVGVLIWLKRRPFPLPPPGIEGEVEGEVEAVVDAIGVELARASTPDGHGGRFVHLLACYARAWDLVHWGRLPAYTPGQAAEYGRTPHGEFGGYFSFGWTPAACAHVMVHQYSHLSLYDLAARQRLARCDHALRYLNPVANANMEIAARIACALIPLAVAGFLGVFIGALSAVVVMVLVITALFGSCQDYPPTMVRYETIYEAITGDDLYTRRHFASSPDPLLREWLGW